LGSTLVKLPQIVKIYRAGNVAGLSAAAISLELAGAAASVSYYAPLGYAFSTWGESLFLLLQTLCIFILYCHYKSGLDARFAAVLALYLAVGVALYTRSVPDLVLPQAACAALGLTRCLMACEDLAGTIPVALGFFSRLPQIVQNMRQGHTGQLAPSTYVLNTLGAAARIFTTLQELDDPLALIGAVMAFLQNAAIVAQMVMYRGQSPEAKAKKTP